MPTTQPNNKPTRRSFPLSVGPSKFSKATNFLANQAQFSQQISSTSSRNPLTLSLSSTLCFLHAIAATLALWAGPYLSLSRQAPPWPVAAGLYAACQALLPTMGTLLGASLCDLGFWRTSVFLFSPGVF